MRPQSRHISTISLVLGRSAVSSGDRTPSQQGQANTPTPRSGVPLHLGRTATERRRAIAATTAKLEPKSAKATHPVSGLDGGVEHDDPVAPEAGKVPCHPDVERAAPATGHAALAGNPARGLPPRLAPRSGCRLEDAWSRESACHRVCKHRCQHPARPVGVHGRQADHMHHTARVGRYRRPTKKKELGDPQTAPQNGVDGRVQLRCAQFPSESRDAS